MTWRNNKIPQKEIHRAGSVGKTKHPPQVIEERREATIEVVKNIEEVEEICSKVVDQVSQTWEAIMDG